MTNDPRIPAAASIGRRGALLLGAGALLAQTAAYAQTAALEGRRFDGVVLQRGKTSGDADTALFQGGRFRSTARDRYGCGDAPYRTRTNGDPARVRVAVAVAVVMAFAPVVVRLRDAPVRSPGRSAGGRGALERALERAERHQPRTIRWLSPRPPRRTPAPVTD